MRYKGYPEHLQKIVLDNCLVYFHIAILAEINHLCNKAGRLYNGKPNAFDFKQMSNSLYLIEEAVGYGKVLFCMI